MRWTFVQLALASVVIITNVLLVKPQMSLTCYQQKQPLGGSGTYIMGRVGKQGPKGDKGDQGECIKGMQGERGIQGIQGVKGDQGICVCPALDSLTQQLLVLERELVDLRKSAYPKECSEVPHIGSHVVTIYPRGKTHEAVRTMCDMRNGNGADALTVFQRRTNGAVNFYRGWDEYVDGFGDVGGEHWLGLETLHHITTRHNMMLRVDLEDRDGNTAYAQYSTFKVAGADTNYTLTIAGYSGTAGDSMDLQEETGNLNNISFSTHDRDNDRYETNCAVDWGGAWWYNSCSYSNLNGDYSVVDGKKSVMWWHWRGRFSLKTTQMALKRV